MAGMISLPMNMYMGGGIDFAKYRMKQYREVSSVSGKGILIGFHYNGKETFVLMTLNSMDLRFDTDGSSTAKSVTVGIVEGLLSDGNILVNTGFKTSIEHSIGIFFPIYYDNGISFNRTLSYITVLEYIG